MIFWLFLCLGLIIANDQNLPDLDIIKKLIKKKQSKIDTSKIKIDPNKGINLNFIPSNPSKGRVSDYTISDVRIEDIKKAAKSFDVDNILDNEIAILETSKGTIKIKLFNNKAPNHCLNFKKLCNSRFYDKTSFHRVYRDFMIQGGDILSRDNTRSNDGEGSPGWSIDAELNDISHKRGIVSMARGNSLNSAGSQFFICVKDSPWLDGKYTVFGEVVEGMDVVDRISMSPTDRDLALQQSHLSIPPSESDNHSWIKILDNETKKEIYFKIPLGDNATSYSDKIKKEIRSRNPYRRIEINQARVQVE